RLRLRAGERLAGVVGLDVHGLTRMVAVAVAGVVPGDGEATLDLTQSRVHVADVHVAEQATVPVLILVGNAEPHALVEDQSRQVVTGLGVAALTSFGRVDADQ